MKRFFLLIMTVMLSLTLIAPQSSVFAERSPNSDVLLTLNGINDAYPGDEVDITLHISGDYQAHVFNLSINYDSSALEIVGLVNGSFMTTNVQAVNGISVIDYETLAANGQVKVGIMMPTTAMMGEGDMLTMTFRIKEGVTVNQQVVLDVIELAEMPVGETVSKPISFTTENAIITINGASDPEEGFNHGTSGTPDPHRTNEPQEGIMTNDPNSPPKPEVTKSPEAGESGAPDTTLIPGDEPIGGNDNKDAENDNTIVYVLCAVVGVGAIAVVIIIIKRGRKKTNIED